MSAFIAFATAKFVEFVVPLGATLLSIAKDLLLATGVAILDSILRYAVKTYSPIPV